MPLVQRSAYLETTILADALLKPGTKLQSDATEALNRFSTRELPHYALKEFKGVLQYLVWLHNCFVTEKTLSGALARIHRVMRRQHGRAATGLELIATQVALLSKSVNPSTAAALGLRFDPDTLYGMEIRVALKTLIFKSWVKRTLNSKLANSLSCVDNSGPSIDKSGLIVL
jgi:hypothetical protein